jgi:hypothetical protein
MKPRHTTTRITTTERKRPECEKKKAEKKKGRKWNQTCLPASRFHTQTRRKKNKPVEVDLLGLDLAVLDVDLVTAQDDGNRLAHPHDVPVPVGDVLVCHARCDVEHDDRTVALDVIACT